MIKLTNASVEHISEDSNTLTQIKKVAEICLGKSDERIISKDYVERLIAKGQESILEHGTVYLPLSEMSRGEDYDIIHSNYSTCSNSFPDGRVRVTTNMRVTLDAYWGNYDFMTRCVKVRAVPYCEDFIRRITLKITCDRLTAQELSKHRAFSFTQSNWVDSHNFITPDWWTEGEGSFTLLEDKIQVLDNEGNVTREITTPLELITLSALNVSSGSYECLRHKGLPAEQAAPLLSSALQTTVVMTGTIPQWEKIIKDESREEAYPSMKSLMKQASKIIEEITR